MTVSEEHPLERAVSDKCEMKDSQRMGSFQAGGAEHGCSHRRPLNCLRLDSPITLPL